jgi:hypothetical protein
MGLVGVDLFAEKVVDDLDLSGSARPVGHGGNGCGRDKLASGPEPPGRSVPVAAYQIVLIAPVNTFDR